MKKLLMALLLLSTLSTFAKTVECQNMSENWEEDSLIINLETMKANYFDNDINWTLSCKKEEIAIFCSLEGNEDRFAARILDDGKAVVIYSYDQWIDFQCDL
jgi:hypothetical protein